MVYVIYSRLGGNNKPNTPFRQADRIVIRLTPRPHLLDSGFRRNDDGVLFWLYVIPAYLQKANRKSAKSVLTCLITLIRIEPAHRLEVKARSV